MKANMKKVKYLIIGGGIAGTTAAEFICINDSSGSIAIVTEEPDRLYSRVLLPHYLRDKIPFDRMFVRSMEDYAEKNIQLITNTKVEKINTESKKISLDNGEEIQYEKLLLSSGGKVNKLDIKGSELKGVTYLRTNHDAKEIKEQMNKAKSGVVVGGGFIGIEFAQSFVKVGIKTYCIVREPNFWSLVVGENSGRLINNILEKNGVEVLTNSEVSEFVGDQSLSLVKLNEGKEISAEIVGIGVGIHFDLDYLNDSQIKNEKGVITNEYLETNKTDVWSAGDVAEFKDLVFDKYHQLGNWSNAAAQGKIVGQNMTAGFGSGTREKFETISAYTIPIFDGTFTFLGDPSSDQNTQLIERGSVEENKMVRLHLREDIIVGASLINSPRDRNPISNLIKNRVKIEVGKEKLADTKFDLGQL
jgi:NAD(P)H-nitrite reductase large subunit